MLHKYLKNALTYEECDEIYNAYIKVKKRQVGIYNLPKSIEYADKIKNQVIEFGEIVLADVYTRTYIVNESLLPHIDQEKYDVTISVNINGNQDWYMHCANDEYIKHTNDEQYRVNWNPYKNNFTSYATKRGDGIVCLGKKCVHWRNSLIVDKNETVTQTMFHFTFV